MPSVEIEKLSHLKALDLISRWCDVNRIIHAERGAIITHWLQNPKAAPIFMDRSMGYKWAGLLHDCIEDKRPKLRANSISNITDDVDYSQAPLSGTSSVGAFRFIDLFAGIGGFRIAMQNVGGKCVFASEWDEAAKQTYFNNYGEIPFGDIHQFTGSKISDGELKALIPDHEVLTAGFPCQPFSLAGVSSRRSLGLADGFACQTQGTLFFDIARIARLKKPKVLFLENVKNLINHDGGLTFKVIKNTIEEELGYSFNSTIIDSSSVVPQRRLRCYMVCFLDKRIEFTFPSFTGAPRPLSEALQKQVPSSFTISQKMWRGHLIRSKRNRLRGTGFITDVADLNKPSKTIVARYGKDGKECLVPQQGTRPRMLTPRECANLQGYPDNFLILASKTSAYRQFGNSVAVPVVQRIADEIRKRIK
jgi:DNA (cytosine-5)-methyltransferase 1